MWSSPAFPNEIQGETIATPQIAKFTRVLSAPDAPHVGPMNLAIMDCSMWTASETTGLCWQKTNNVLIRGGSRKRFQRSGNLYIYIVLGTLCPVLSAICVLLCQHISYTSSSVWAGRVSCGLCFAFLAFVRCKRNVILLAQMDQTPPMQLLIRKSISKICGTRIDGMQSVVNLQAYWVEVQILNPILYWHSIYRIHKTEWNLSI